MSESPADSTSTLTSVGIDVGTTTTHLVVSELAVESAGVSGTEKLAIGDRTVRFRGPVHETPLIDPETVDTEAVAGLIAADLDAAGVTPAEIDTGAVIVTGETARTANAEPLAHRLADESGSFVVATAGAALEAVLAGRGSGSAAHATESQTTVANVDVGGGTTNTAIFDADGTVETRCLDVGGRLVGVDDGTITKLAAPARAISEANGLDLSLGEPVDPDKLSALASAMAALVIDSLLGPPYDRLTLELSIGSLPDEPRALDAVVFTGGVGRLVGEHIDSPVGTDPFAYGDLGPLLAEALTEAAVDSQLSVTRPSEDLRATVIGAGTHTTRLSGRTVCIDPDLLPLRNLPVISAGSLADIDNAALTATFSTVLEQATQRYDVRDIGGVAIGIDDTGGLSYDRLRAVASSFVAALENGYPQSVPITVVTHQNCAKALGQLLRANCSDRPLVVIDELAVGTGEYLDIGKPIAHGETVPAVVKTLVFGS
ncbi:ethanolamine ammonia-lyase reactivating factor EutA [Halorubrum sp. DTA46]|uniref:ethanolamine ammonia-lyase reactivating factor EutA n=1 Tax=Halorubrum sp. DTA46 TaxID=3402162 RepID=UPI003AB0CADD